MKKIKQAFLLVFAIPILMACNNIGKKVKNGDVVVYFKDGISESEASKTAELIYNKYSSISEKEPTRKKFQLCKINDTICLKMVVNENAENNNNDSYLGKYISDSVFNSAPVNMHFTDKQFETKKLFYYKKINY